MKQIVKTVFFFKNQAISRIVLVVVLLFVSQSLKAQGDNCDQALNLADVTNFCSSGNQYTNLNSTPSSVSIANCWGSSVTYDVWFSFVAIGSNALISVNGNTMYSPSIAIYSGSCSGGLNQVACADGSFVVSDIQLFNSSLVQGTTYYIRVSTAIGDRGSFQLCINNFTPPPTATSDCDGAGKLCNKDAISVTNLISGGANIYEVAGTCLGDFGFTETNSVWYTWTCQNAGTLTMDIIPANQSDDIDFVIWQLSTTNPCGPRTVIRCSATSFLNPNAGTGLNASSVDVNESSGWSGIEDAYVQQINMTAGTSYAILINNFSATNGFTLNWGGTGTFVGPDANITNGPFTLCAGSSIAFDGSTSINYNNLIWNFLNGNGSPSTPNGPGPVSITYPTPGTYTAILNATSATGCTSTETAIVTVNPNTPATFAAVPAFCEGQPAPSFPSQTNTPAIAGTWSPNVISNMTSGSYTFTPNAGQCSTTPVTITVTVNPLVTPTFSALPSYCVNDVPLALPATSINSISGTWSPATINTSVAGTSNYTFTPSAGSCASTVIVPVVINPATVPTFNPIGPFCSGDVVPGLPATSINGISGTWSPPTINNTATGNYIFTPSGGICIANGNLSVTINAQTTPNLTQVGPFCTDYVGVVNLTADIPNGTWSGIGITDPAGIFDPSVAGVGTHTITYMHTVGCGGSNTMTLTVNPLPNSNFSADLLSGCDPLKVTFTSDPSVDQSLWSFGDNTTGSAVGSIEHIYDTPGIFTVSLTNTDNGCSSMVTMTSYISVYPSPTASFTGNPSSMFEDETHVQFNNNSVGNNTNLWDFGDGTIGTTENAQHEFPHVPGSYVITLTVTNEAGCSDQATFIITVNENQFIYVPNSFTPDGDEHNNIFQPVIEAGFDEQNYSFTVFDRWGEVLFESHDVDKGWDGTYHGKLVPSGVYTWSIRVKNKRNDEYQVFLGHLTVLR